MKHICVCCVVEKVELLWLFSIFLASYSLLLVELVRNMKFLIKCMNHFEEAPLQTLPKKEEFTHGIIVAYISF